MIPALVTMSTPAAYSPDSTVALCGERSFPSLRFNMLAKAAAMSLIAILTSVALAQSPDPNARIIAALELPHAANEARRSGVGDDQIQIVLSLGKDKKAESGDVAKALRAGAEGVKENGPIDNFGAFVQAQLDAGLRGQDLAAAIKAEHAANGKGKGPPPQPKGGPKTEGVGAEKGQGAGQGVGKAPGEMGKGTPPAGKMPPKGAGGKPPEGKGSGKAPPKGDGSSGEASKGGGRK